MKDFLHLLMMHGVEVLADVRSHPYSAYARHFDTEPIAEALARAGVKYVYLGKELGGRPDTTEFYNSEGYVLYSRIAESIGFLEGIRRLENGIRRFQVAIMCSEEDPLHCHRRLLIGRVLAQRGIMLDHIRGDGQVQTEVDLASHGLERQQHSGQVPLFDEPREIEWKSIRSVSRKGPRPNSSAR